MSYQSALEILFPDRPFFGGDTAGAQTGVIHHLIMIAIVAMLAEEEERPIRVLEVGSWMGFSALTWCHAVGRFSRRRGTVLCVDTWAPYFDHSDTSTGGAYSRMERMSNLGLAYDLFLHNMKFRSRDVEWNHMRGSSIEVLPYLRPDSFDIVYIDGSHYYDAVKSDIDNSLPLVRDGGILCGDDLNLQMHEIDEGLVRSVLTHDCYTIPATETFFHPGVTLAVGERFGPVSGWAGMWAMRKRGSHFEAFTPTKVPLSTPDHFSPEQRQAAEQFLRASL